MFGAPAAGHLGDTELDAALIGELEGIRQQVLQHLLQAFRVGRDAAVEGGIELHLERQAPVIRLVAERPRHHVDQVGEEDVLDIDRHGARFDLR